MCSKGTMKLKGVVHSSDEEAVRVKLVDYHVYCHFPIDTFSVSVRYGDTVAINISEDLTLQHIQKIDSAPNHEFVKELSHIMRNI
jgi:hypothetical protein